MTKPSDIELLVDAIDAKVRQELRKRCEALKPDFVAPEVFSVLTALLARQATLALEITSAPQLWNGHSAPLFMRAMTDVHITLSWILMDTNARVQQYVNHGLGQAVLELERRKKRLESMTGESKEAAEKFIRSLEAWINHQKWSFLVEINIGAWSGKNTREMAEEAGILDFYNYVYVPFSQCAHSTWYHVGRYNSRPSDSPLTSLLRIPCIADSPGDVWNLDLAAKYLDKSFNAFDEKALGVAPSSDIRDWIGSEIESRFGSSNDTKPRAE
jgi:hypothetical protein